MTAPLGAHRRLVRRRLPVGAGVLVAVLTLAACSSSATPAATPSTTAAPATAAATTTTTTSALLAVTDLPDGWQKVPQTGPLSSLGACLAPFGTGKLAGGSPARLAGFDFGGDLPGAVEILASFEPGTVAGSYAVLTRSLNGCVYHFAAGGDAVSGPLVPLAAEQVGDHSTAFDVRVATADGATSVIFVVFRRGNAIGIVEYADEGAPVAMAATQIAAIAAAKS